MKRHLFLLCYDIREQSRLKKALQAVRHYATGGQKSVHECWMTTAERDRLIAELKQVVDLSEDVVLVIPLREDIRVMTFGKALAPVRSQWVYVG